MFFATDLQGFNFTIQKLQITLFFVKHQVFHLINNLVINKHLVINSKKKKHRMKQLHYNGK